MMFLLQKLEEQLWIVSKEGDIEAVCKLLQSEVQVDGTDEVN